MSLTDRVRELQHLLGKLLPRTVSKGRKADEEPSQEVMMRLSVLLWYYGTSKLSSPTSCIRILGRPRFKCMNKRRCSLMGAFVRPESSTRTCLYI